MKRIPRKSTRRCGVDFGYKRLVGRRGARTFGLGSRRPGQPRHRVSYENWLREWINAVSVLDIDEETIQSYAAIGLGLKRKGTPIPVKDLWIAALCHQHSLPLLSRDRHFDLLPGLRRIDW